MEKNGSTENRSPSQLIDARIEELGDWRGKMLGRLRTLVKEADPWSGSGEGFRGGSTTELSAPARLTRTL